MKLMIAVLFCLTLSAQDLATRMDGVISAAVAEQKFMGTVLVAKGGKIVLEKGYGMADLELDVPNTPDKKFRLGSITKQFTAAAIMQFQERGKLAVTDLACKFVEDCPEAWKAITVHQLLTHTSGIQSYTGMPEFPKPQFLRVPMKPLEIVMISRNKPLDFQPGEGYKYNNTGYLFLGYIIEKVTGDTYAHYLGKNIFGPLGMKDSGYDDTVTVMKGRAKGYGKGVAGLKNADYLDMSLPHAAGSLYSTVRDLYLWDRALYTDKVVSRKSYAAMTTVVRNNYGYGLNVDKMAGHNHVAHGGGIPGFSTMISRSNLESGAPGPLAKQLAELLFQ